MLEQEQQQMALLLLPYSRDKNGVGVGKGKDERLSLTESSLKQNKQSKPLTGRDNEKKPARMQGRAIKRALQS